MATIITISHKSLNNQLGSKITLNELEEILFNMGFELESHEGDTLSIEITPERLDLLSLQGLSRAIKSFKDSKLPTIDFKLNKGNYVVNVTKKVKEVRPFTVCAVIKNLNMTDENIQEIINVQEKLHMLLARKRVKGAIGIYPLDAIKMPITYTAAKPKDIKFIPLGKDKIMHGLEILEFHETGKEYAHLLKGKETFPYFIDSNGEILSMPPIINSEKTGRVTNKTKDIFIECSGFDKLLLNEMLTNIVTMFSDMGGDIFEVEVKYEQEKTEKLPKLTPQKITVKKSTIKQLLGLELKDKEITKLLTKMMYEVTKINENSFEVKAPCYRRDIWHEIDVADDIARAYGYNNFKLKVPEISTVGETLPLSDLKEQTADVMVGLGHLEVYTNVLTSEKENIDNMLLKNYKQKYVKIINGNENQTMMRLSLIPELLKSLSNNRSNPIPQKIFEAGLVIIPDDKQDVKSRNEMHVSAMITNKTATFTEIKQTLNALLKTRNLTCEIKTTKHPSFIEGRVGNILINKKLVGIVGELHPQVLINFGLITPVSVFEFNLEEILEK
ncbi:MAG: phenylalanine--tRNA ligase subunit beta [Candidatus Woesearchaeota archaeon]